MTWRSILTTLPAPGTIVDVDGQRYELVRTDPYVRRDGTVVELLVWRSCCAECGAEYFARTASTARGGLVRRCRQHRSQGKKLIPGSTRRSSVTLITPEPAATTDPDQDCHQGGSA
jgi:hypothetical protein